MVYTIVWTERAEASWHQIIDWIAEQGSIIKAEKFIQRTEEVLSHLEYYPLIYQASRHNDLIRKCSVTDDISLFYSIDDAWNVLLLFWDNRRNPEALNL